MLFSFFIPSDVQGNERAGLDPLLDMYGLQEEEEEEEELVVPSVREPTRQVNYGILKQGFGSALLLCGSE